MVYPVTKRLNGLHRLAVAYCSTGPFDLLNKEKRG